MPSLRGLLPIATVVSLAIGCAQPGLGGSVAAGMRDCGPLPASACDEAVANVAGIRAPEVEGFQIRCTAPTCGNLSGSIDVGILWVDGTSETQSATWANGPFDPSVFAPRAAIRTPPVPPTCAGVPEAECLGEWTTAMENLSAAQIDDVALVLVRCSGICTASSGAGETFIGFQDGTRIRPSTWSYNHSP